MSVFDFIDARFFVLSLIIGLFAVYISMPDLRTVYIEVDKDQIECEDILTNYGFVLIDMPSNNQIWRRPG